MKESHDLEHVANLLDVQMRQRHGTGARAFLRTLTEETLTEETVGGLEES